MDDLELGGGELSIRIERDGEIVVAYDGEPIPVTAIDIDPASIDRLASQPKTVRDL